MAIIDKTYRKEELLDWERISYEDKFSVFSFSQKSTWLALGLTVLGLSLFAFIAPFIPPRYGWADWMPVTTVNEYQSRLTSFLIAIPIMVVTVFAYLNLRNKIDSSLGVKWTANFKITNVLNLGAIKILFMNGWRPFSIRTEQQYFKSVTTGQIITIKRTGTHRLIDYYIRNEKTYNDEQGR